MSASRISLLALPGSGDDAANGDPRKKDGAKTGAGSLPKLKLPSPVSPRIPPLKPLQAPNLLGAAGAGGHHPKARGSPDSRPRAPPERPQALETGDVIADVYLRCSFTHIRLKNLETWILFENVKIQI